MRFFDDMLTEFEIINEPHISPDVDVSIWCVTYNHVEYIADAFEGFVSQKGSVRYEIVVFDDASSDGTSNIVRKYAKKYPGIICAYIAKKNTYRQIGRREMILNLKKKCLHGKYIAYCEGDDCRIDPYKLQRQFDYMEKHVDCSLYMHNCIWLDCETGRIKVGESFK